MGLGALPAPLRGPRLGGPRPQPAQPLLVADGGPDDARRRVIHRGRRRGDGAARPEGRRRSATGWAACWSSRPPSASPVAAYVLIAPEPPSDLREPARPHVVRDIPDAYGRAELGWETLPEKLLREHRDLTLADVLRIQHLLGQKPSESGAREAPGAPRRAGGPAALPDVPRLVIGGGLDTQVPEPDVERLADWLGCAVRAVRGPLALRPRARRAELPPGRRDAPGVPGDQPPVAGALARGGGFAGPLGILRPVGPPDRPRAAFV